jgi:hypothetical protein
MLKVLNVNRLTFPAHHHQQSAFEDAIMEIAYLRNKNSRTLHEVPRGGCSDCFTAAERLLRNPGVEERSFALAAALCSPSASLQPVVHDVPA